MNELLVIGSLCLRKDFWDPHGANIATRERLFRSPKITILERDYRFFAAFFLFLFFLIRNRFGYCDWPEK